MWGSCGRRWKSCFSNPSWRSTADRRVSGQQPSLTVLSSRLLFANTFWYLQRASSDTRAAVAAFPRHVKDLIHLSTFQIQGIVVILFFYFCAHTDASEPFTDHMQRHTGADSHLHTSNAADTHTLQRLPVPSPNWIVCSDNPQDSRSIDVRSRPMKIQGPWGAEGAMHIFTAWLATSSTTKEHISASVYLNRKCRNSKREKKKNEVLICTKLCHVQICMRLQCSSSDSWRQWTSLHCDPLGRMWDRCII